jgi:predicted PurR-regulated permease PerM
MLTHLPRRQTRPSNPARQAATSLRRLAAALAAAACALLASAAIIPAAWAMIPYTGGTPAVRVVTEGGMPGWQITLIALGAALVAATTAVLLDRARAARRPSPATTA